jgi:ribosomal protein S18 acetylase RimI-like enzyme
MHRAEQGLRNLGCAKLNLQVRASNLQVIAFYESLGFSVEDRASLGKPLD